MKAIINGTGWNVFGSSVNKLTSSFLCLSICPQVLGGGDGVSFTSSFDEVAADFVLVSTAEVSVAVAADAAFDAVADDAVFDVVADDSVLNGVADDAVCNAVADDDVFAAVPDALTVVEDSLP